MVKGSRKWFSSHKPSLPMNDWPVYISNESKKKILDPREPFLQKWNKIFVLSCIIAVALDSLFFYIPVIDSSRSCLSQHKNVKIIACVLRSFVDVFYIFHIFLQFRTGSIVSSRFYGRKELVEDSEAIAKRYLCFYFIIDILSILPLPQVAITKGPISHVTKEMLKGVIIVQYIPRIWRIYPLYKEVTSTLGIFTETAWAGAAFNLFLYMLASHILGSFWYLFAIERRASCWREACEKTNSRCSDVYELYCREGGNNTLFLSSVCPLLDKDQLNATSFDFGIALDALRAGIVEHENFFKKWFFCFWWGLQNLSSLGQNLKTSTFEGEILFAVCISVIGLILFSFFIGNMQKYLESITTKVELEMRVKRHDAEQWMSHRMLPEELRNRVRRYEQYKWQKHRGVDEESFIRNLPNDLRRDIKRHLCWTLLQRVPVFNEMDEKILDALCLRLKPILYTAASLIVREGDPLEAMLFIMRGHMHSMTTNGGRSGYFNGVSLMAGDFCGEELLTWVLDPKSSSSLPNSTRTVRAATDVEAFCLMPDDLKNVVSKFSRLFQSKQMRSIFRHYSQQWRSWGACYIQAAWRQYYRRKIERELREAEERMQGALDQGGHARSIGAAIYASRFARNMLPRSSHHLSNNMSSPKSATLLPQNQKPSEPDFSTAGEEGKTKKKRKKKKKKNGDWRMKNEEEEEEEYLFDELK